jgi:hypothetical protein
MFQATEVGSWTRLPNFDMGGASARANVRADGRAGGADCWTAFAVVVVMLLLALRRSPLSSCHLHGIRGIQGLEFSMMD